MSAPDIIDLDRYMRARPAPRRDPRGPRGPRGSVSRLVVDAGGPKPQTQPHTTDATDSSSSTRRKRYSHDSGLSDGSYRRARPPRPPRPREHRRSAAARDCRPTDSNNSMRTFRITCERALRDQQEQIARVAELCERLTAVKTQRKPHPRSLSAGSSDISSTSRSSTRDHRRNDKPRVNEFKTYKIIMTKLDELNRLFSASRGRSTAGPGVLGARAAPGGLGYPGGPGLRRRNVPSSGSVTVSDKVVATEPDHADAPRLASPRTVPRVVERGVGGCRPGRAHAHAHAHTDQSRSTSRRTARAPALLAARAPARAAALTRPHHLQDSLLNCEFSEEADSSVCPPHCPVEFDDPIMFFTEAKRAQAPRSSRRTQSADASQPRRSSVCAAWRGYWRSLATCIAGPLLGRPTTV